MDSISPIPRNMIGPVADALRGGKDFLNKPGKLMGIGLGDLVMGQAPEMLDNASYGQSPFSHGKGLTTKMDPGLVDAALLPGIASIPALLRKGGQAAAQAVPAAVDMGRRAAMGNIGKGAVAAGMTASSIPHVISALKSAPAAKAIAAEAVPLAVKAEAGLSARTLAGLSKILKDIHMDQGEGAAPHAIEEILANGKRISGANDEVVAQGLDRLAGFYGHGDSFNPIQNPGAHWTYGPKTFEDLKAMGIGDSPDDIIKAVFEGKVLPHELGEDVIMRTGMSRQPTEWTNLLDDLVHRNPGSAPLSSTPVLPRK